jgi:hypothetical protein
MQNLSRRKQGTLIAMLRLGYLSGFYLVSELLGLPLLFSLKGFHSVLNKLPMLLVEFRRVQL